MLAVVPSTGVPTGEMDGFGVGDGPTPRPGPPKFPVRPQFAKVKRVEQMREYWNIRKIEFGKCTQNESANTRPNVYARITFTIHEQLMKLQTV